MPMSMNNPFMLYPTPQTDGNGISTPQRARGFADRLHDRVALAHASHGPVHTRVPSQDDEAVPSYVHTPTDDLGDWSQQPSFTYDTSEGAKISIPKDPPSLSSASTLSGKNNDWPLTEKYYSLSSENQDLRCPRSYLWRTILLPAVIVIFPMAFLVAGLLGLIFGYRVKSADSLFAPVSNSNALSNNAVVLVNYSATRIAFVASWASTLAPLLASFIMNLSSFQTALVMFRSSSGPNQHDLPTPYQYSLLVGLCLASSGRLRRYFSYSKEDGVVIPPVLRRAARTLTLTLVLAVVVFAADTALHYTTSTINFDQISITPTPQTHAYGRALSEECLTLNRSANFGLPCSRNGIVSSTDYDEYVAGQNEIFYLLHGTSNISQIVRVDAPEEDQQSSNNSNNTKAQVALLLPQTANLSPYRDYRATTAGVITECTPISSECEWKTSGPEELYSQFNCSKNFWGVLGKAPNVTDTGTVVSDDDVPPLGFKPGSSLQYSFFMDETLNVPYDSSGEDGPFMPDAELINPVWLGVAARFALTSQRAGVNMTADPGVHKGPTSSIDFVLRCRYTTYAADYDWVNSTATITTLEASPNGTLAEIYHGYNIPGSYNSFDNDLQDYVLQAALQPDATALAASFAASYSSRVMSVIGPFLSARTNAREQIRTPLLVAKVPKAPLAILAACCLGYVVFGVFAAVSARRALADVDVRDLAWRFGLPALALHAFRDGATDRAATTSQGQHRLFDESKIRGETMRVAVEGDPGAGFLLKSLV